MNDILQLIAENKRREVESMYPEGYLEGPEEIVHPLLPSLLSMKESILTTKGGIIAEFKRRSPSKGDISPMADVSTIISQYYSNGAAAFSVLTDTRFFGGSTFDLAVAKKFSNEKPVLRKEFIISKIQIKEARLLGANAILLIAAILNKDELEVFNEYAHDLGLEVLLEIHDIHELNKIHFQPDMLGVNNRNLSSFHTDVKHSYQLAKSLPQDCLLVAESGIKTSDDVKRLQDVGFRGFLIGEAFMSSPNPGETLKNFIDEIG